MSDLDLATPREGKLGIMALVAVLHILAILGLIRAFAPGAMTAAVESVVSTFTVTITTPPTPVPPPAPAPKAAGAASPAGKKANPREHKAPEPKLRVSPTAKPTATGSGSADHSGASSTGQGSGAGGQGNGTGSGTGGTGQGGGTPTPLEKIAGEISSTRDFPRSSADRRNGTSVTIELSVGTDGRANDCRVVSPGGDPEADQIVCRLAVQRFRFRPRTDGAGNPQPGRYRWRQRWWDPRN
jgi:periplasmic protein TonB